ncbi:hypothetical protein [Jannaschia marina]|uniref:hypothetical protein n=1 Tax=Jannaschia marina TaxID=2741674 RepID=UPI0015C90D1F|nr:hypothetical protein [Jannaschia marina]
MTLKISAAAAALAMITGAPAFANTTQVSCPDGGYVIAMSAAVAIQGKAQAGGTRGFERVVCERSADAANLESGSTTVVPVFIEELGVATRVVIFKN